MRIRSFTAVDLNHVPAFDLTFEKEVSFLTGVNGSGKTAILRSINALLSPNLEALAALSYSKISVEFELDGKAFSLSAIKNDGNVVLKSSSVKEDFVFSIYEEDAFSYSDPEVSKTYYRDLLAQKSGESAVLDFLLEVPTPMYLGLDRRHSAPIRRYRRMRGDPRSRKRNVFSTPLGDSLKQAISLAEDRFAAVRFETSKFDSEFNRDLLLSLLEVPESDPFAIKPPTAKDRKLIESARKALRSFPRIEGVSADDIRAKLDPALTDIGDIVSKIPTDFDFPSSIEEGSDSERHISNVLQWIRMKPLLLQITKVADLVNNYNDKVKKAREHINQYTRLVDDFYRQTGKSLGFSPNGRVQVQTTSGQFGVDDLSSGEAQIFVILTHLAFNPHAQEAGVFIIDEPELSLHLFWQDMLVDNMLKANAGIQYIMATHSPAIIGERVEHAHDLTPSI